MLRKRVLINFICEKGLSTEVAATGMLKLIAASLLRLGNIALNISLATKFFNQLHVVRRLLGHILDGKFSTPKLMSLEMMLLSLSHYPVAFSIRGQIFGLHSRHFLWIKKDSMLGHISRRGKTA